MMQHSTNALIILGCTVFNLFYLIGWIIAGVLSGKRRMTCVKCKRDWSKSVMCKYCKHYKNSLAYYAAKHPEKIELIGTEDNYKEKGNK